MENFKEQPKTNEYDVENPESAISRLHGLVQKQTLKEADAVVWLEGDKHDRSAQAIKLIQKNYAPYIILSGGAEKSDEGDIPAPEAKKFFQASGIDERKIIIEQLSQNTKEQAENVLHLAKERGMEKIILVASPYHQMRAFLTFLAELKKRGLDEKIELINAPAELNWFKMVSGRNGMKAVDLFLEEEIPRIVRYRAQGDVASFEEGIDYLKKWEKAES